MSFKVAMSNFSAFYYGRLLQRGIDLTPVDLSRGTGQALETLRAFDGIAALNEDYSAPVLDALQGRLQIIAKHGAGYNNIDVPYATRLGICCCNTPGTNAASVAETALYLMLECVRGFGRASRAMRGGAWPVVAPERELSELTVGLIGFGHIGRQLARILHAMGARVLAYSPHMDCTEAARCGAEAVSLPALQRLSDVISLHLPLSADTCGLVDEAFLARVKPGCVLVNTSRGGLIEERAMLRALDNGTIKAVGLDVFAQEPLPPDSPLRSDERIVTTPHMAGSTASATLRGLDAMAEAFLAYQRGVVPPHCLNPEYVDFLRR